MMDKPRYSQIMVIVSVIGIDDDAQVFYTFTDFRSGGLVLDSVAANIYAQVPYDTVFALDYASTRNGWRFREHIEMIDGEPLENWRSDSEMLMTTRLKAAGLVKPRFYLKFHNDITHACFKNDPQEGNVPQPKGPDQLDPPENRG